MQENTNWKIIEITLMRKETWELNLIANSNNLQDGNLKFNQIRETEHE